MEGSALLVVDDAVLHTFPESLAYDQKLQDTDLAYLFSSETALGSLAQSYEGWPF